MKILYYDCFSGISGDMNLGALIDIGVDKNYLINELLKLNICGYELNIKRDVKNGISGTKVDVILKHNHSQYEDHKHEHHDDHSNIIRHEHDHEHNNHNHEKSHVHETFHDHQHRNLKDIESIIEFSSLNQNVKNISLKIFKKVAEAEAKVHNKSIEEVHFHEVGAVDSIVDIVGAAICFDYLKVDKIKCSTVEVGSGFVKCAHGLLPIPAPATAEILKDTPIKSNISFEATTPTGAAILAYAVDQFTDSKNFSIKRVGYGIGTKDNKDVPNMLRVFIGEEKLMDESNGECKDIDTDFLQDEVEVIECNIDDMNPEMYEYVMELLFANGALDVYMTPIIMKKERPGVKLNVLYTSDKEEIIKKIVLMQTTTLGFRKYKAERNMLKREFAKVKTKYGKITVKNAYYNGKIIKSKPEYEECKKIALDNNININEIYKEVLSKI
jgi:pyridinium-3,5-bisthiocarboxylic acid mononucleotide nickel chelatase